MDAISAQGKPFRPREKCDLGEGKTQDSRYNIFAEGALPPGLITMVTKVIRESYGICRASQNEN